MLHSVSFYHMFALPLYLITNYYDQVIGSQSKRLKILFVSVVTILKLMRDALHAFS